VDGAAEVIQDGVNGYLVEPRDLEGMAERILRILVDPAAVRRGRPQALPVEFDIHEMVRLQEREYDRLLGPLDERYRLSISAGCGTSTGNQRSC
jgi:glycosyltransferase involved in cell wall biosynthesis